MRVATSGFWGVFAMNAPFEAAKLKIERANKHIQELELSIASYFSENPCALVVEPFPGTLHSHAWIARIRKPVPLFLSAIIGVMGLPASQIPLWTELPARFFLAFGEGEGFGNRPVVECLHELTKTANCVILTLSSLRPGAAFPTAT